MLASLSPAARATLVEHLERVLSDPAALGDYIRQLGRRPPQPEEWDPGLIQEVLEDPQRLELLDDPELGRLTGDPVGLIALGQEVVRDWWPVWNEPLAAAGRAWRAENRWSPPTWDGVMTAATAAAVEPAQDEPEPAGALGTVLDRPLGRGGRPLLLRWAWARTWEGLGMTCGSAADARKRVEFTLRAYGSRQGMPGAWVLTMTGDPPENPAAGLTVRLDGWGRRDADRTAPVELLSGTTEVDLTGFADPTPVFDRWEDGTATLTAVCDGQAPWRATEEVPGPELNRAFYEAWLRDRVDGFDGCLARVLGGLRRGGGVRDPHLVEQTVVDATRAAYRRRYVYRSISSYADFTRLVATIARRRYRESFRLKSGRKVSLRGDQSDPTDPGPQPDAGLAAADRRAAVADCLTRLDPVDRELIRLWVEEDLAHREIGDRLNLSEGNCRRRRHNALRELAGCLERRGMGPDALLDLG